MEDFFHIKNWPKQLILREVKNNFQYYPATLIAYKECVASEISLIIFQWIIHLIIQRNNDFCCVST